MSLRGYSEVCGFRPSPCRSLAGGVERCRVRFAHAPCEKAMTSIVGALRDRDNGDIDLLPTAASWCIDASVRVLDRGGCAVLASIGICPDAAASRGVCAAARHGGQCRARRHGRAGPHARLRRLAPPARRQGGGRPHGIVEGERGIEARAATASALALPSATAACRSRMAPKAKRTARCARPARNCAPKS